MRLRRFQCVRGRSVWLQPESHLGGDKDDPGGIGRGRSVGCGFWVGTSGCRGQHWRAAHKDQGPGTPRNRLFP